MRRTTPADSGMAFGYERMNDANAGSGVTVTVSPVSSTPRPSAPAAQCATDDPGKCAPTCTSVTPGSGSYVPDQVRTAGPVRRIHSRSASATSTAASSNAALHSSAVPKKCGWLNAIAAMPPSSRTRSTPASSTNPGTSHSRFPAGVRTSSPRCPMPNPGSTPTPNRSGSCSRTTTVCPAASSSSVVHACPPGGTYCRSSAQIAQTSGGSPVSSC